MAGQNGPSPAMVICGRLYVLVVATAAIAASVLMIFSCQFFSYRAIDGEPWEGLSPPFDELESASVGLFSYSETTTNTDTIPLFGDECLKYDDWQSVNDNTYFVVAQWCALVAPGLAFLAWIQVFFDMLCCRLRGGFVLISLLFFFAGAAQGCTFLVFADSDFCFEAESVNKCSFKIGAWYSMGAAIAYLILALLAPIMPLSPYEEKKGMCIVKGSPPAPVANKAGSDEETGDVDLDVAEEKENAGEEGKQDVIEEEVIEEEVIEEEVIEEKEEEKAEDKQENVVCGVDLDNICGNPTGTEVQLEDHNKVGEEAAPVQEKAPVQDDGTKETAAL